MPKVGNKTYPYNTKGMQAAKKAAKKKGKKVTYKKKGKK
jgi:hypothetical protein|tara:strand:+ start:479 stop:595 length:117 start_codon:yes stop_codon:yes gene_type:complete